MDFSAFILPNTVDQIDKSIREISESVMDAFIEANITSACLPMSAMLQDILKRRGIESVVTEGWLIRGVLSWHEPFIVARHYWVETDQLSLDIASYLVDKIMGISNEDEPVRDPSNHMRPETKAFIERMSRGRQLSERYILVKGGLPEEYGPLRRKMRRRMPREMDEERETEQLYQVYLSDRVRFWAMAPPHIRGILGNLIRRWTR